MSTAKYSLTVNMQGQGAISVAPGDSLDLGDGGVIVWLSEEDADEAGDRPRGAPGVIRCHVCNECGGSGERWTGSHRALCMRCGGTGRATPYEDRLRGPAPRRPDPATTR